MLVTHSYTWEIFLTPADKFYISEVSSALHRIA
ncbi:unnamed protein product [Mycetohabitans rhizoxinica HKI 454]|uniref:Uncharacterized protein n=1 Tax=Mycetohabitans rhizoxinica (strain DSM 19002 / CIP 109453 / HKI 454) TaxID=882378 RepID=E5ARU9_MYCRK|nr:unnamed protein product [Mycetohabitans rhizoxinica HKI 454]